MFMKINIIARDNTAGLTADINILTELFHDQGWQVDFNDYKSLKRFAFWSSKTYDLNVFLQWANPQWFKLAEKNILIPNPEWFKIRWISVLNRFDGIFCKTKHAVQIFNKKNTNTVFTSFTSLNRLMAGVEKNKNQYLHIAGKSKMKGTDIIIKTWIKNPDFPHLIVVKRNMDYPVHNQKNLTIISEYVSNDELQLLMNRCAVHLCPSSAEGFGHSIGESLSCGALIVSTDAPPMNELVNPDRGILVKPVRKESKKLSYAYYIDVPGLENAVKHIMQIKKINVLMENAHSFYSDNDRYFRKTIIKAIDDIVTV